MESHEYAPGRVILSEDGDEFHVQDTILGSSGNDWLIVTNDRLDSSPSFLLQAGQVRDTFFPTEPEEQADTSPTAQAQADAERLRNEKRQEKARKKAEKKAKDKKAKKANKSSAKAKPSAKKPSAKKPSAAKRTATPRTGQEATVAAPGPAAVSK